MNKIVSMVLLGVSASLPLVANGQTPASNPEQNPRQAAALLNNFWGLMQEVCNPGGYASKEWSTDCCVKYAGFSRQVPEGNPRMSASFYDNGDRKFSAGLDLLDSLKVTQAEPGIASAQKALYVVHQKDGSYAGRLALQKNGVTSDIRSAELERLNDTHSGNPNIYVPFIKSVFVPAPQ